MGRTARQGSSAAQLLAAEADQLLETISCAADVGCLLEGDETLERGLAHALRLELTLLDELRDQRAKYGL